MRALGCLILPGAPSAARTGDMVVGVSGKNGVYRLVADGACDDYPCPLRAKFNGVYADARGRCWATYQGGLALIQGDRLWDYPEPLGLAGLRIQRSSRSMRTTQTHWAP